MPDPIPREILLVARLEASFSAMAFSMRQAAEAMDAFAFFAHEIGQTNEFQRSREITETTMAIAALRERKQS